MKQSEKPHPGINYHKFSVGGDWEGIFIVIACWVVVMAIPLPVARYFVAGTLVFGIVVGLLLRLFRRDKLVNTHTFLPPADTAHETRKLQPQSSREKSDADAPQSSSHSGDGNPAAIAKAS